MGRNTAGEFTASRRFVASGLDLLPGWFDDGALLKRDRLRRRTLNALEMLSVVLASRGRHGGAADAALLAIAADPLRESAHRALIAVHLVHGTLVDAHRAYESYRVVVRRDLEIEPSRGLRRLLASGFAAAGAQAGSLVSPRRKGPSCPWTSIVVAVGGNQDGTVRRTVRRSGEGQRHQRGDKRGGRS